MSRKKYPPLKPRHVVAILRALGFSLKRQDGTAHAQWELLQGPDGKRKVVTVDMAYPELNDFLMRSIVRQSGFTRDEFYGATKKTAKTANIPWPTRPSA